MALQQNNILVERVGRPIGNVTRAMVARVAK
jgi:hypothetical protein